MPAGIAEHVRIEDHQQHVTPTTESLRDDSERIMLLRLRKGPGIPSPLGLGTPLLLGLAGVSIDGRDFKNRRRTGVCEREGLDRAWKTPS
jgi:hypothetical protein